MADVRITGLTERLASQITDPSLFYIEIDSVAHGSEKIKISQAALAIKNELGFNYLIVGDATRELEANALAVVANTDTVFPNSATGSETVLTEKGDMGDSGGTVWDESTSEFKSDNLGEVIELVIKGSLKKQTDGLTHCKLSLVSNSIQQAETRFLVVEDTGVEQKFTERIRFRVNQTIIDNDAQIIINSPEAISIWGYSFEFFRTYKA